MISEKPLLITIRSVFSDIGPEQKSPRSDSELRRVLHQNERPKARTARLQKQRDRQALLRVAQSDGTVERREHDCAYKANLRVTESEEITAERREHNRVYKANLRAEGERTIRLKSRVKLLI